MDRRRGEVLDGIALRSGDHGDIERTGHVGYGIRPSVRRQGLATWALGQVLNDARRLGLAHLLLVCGEGNVASTATIERNCGTLADARPRRERRYWIALT